jgi:preprotein translocase subunit SecG
MLGFFIGFFTVVLALVCLLMVLIVLMQKPKQEGLGAAFGGGVMDSMYGADATNILQKITVWLAVLFFIITMLLAVLVGVKQKSKINKEQLTTVPENTTTQGAIPSAGQPPSPTTPPPNTIITDPIQIPPAPKPEAEPSEPAAEAPKPEAEPSEPAAEAPKPEAEPSEPAAEAPKPEAETSTPNP